MAKPLLPSKKRGPGRAAQRVKPGEVIRDKLVSKAKGASIGDCHRLYTELKLKDWQKEQIAKIAGVGSVHTLLEEKAIHVHPRSPSKQTAFVTRKMKAVDKIMARKRAPGNVTYENFSKFFHLLKQLGYIAPITEKDFITGKVTKKHEDPNEYKSASLTKGQIEPPVIYQITGLGQSVQDWNNPKKELS